MRIVFGAIAVLMLCGAAGQAQVINGEGNFESNRGFDRAPDDPPADGKSTTPPGGQTKPDTRDRR